ncbi:MAG TPA: hypothetical protein VEY05_13385, partial [Beijerinckiaceae bacterium]|nr:hypothetical protein [Beijerinckiaceae bacterium]
LILREAGALLTGLDGAPLAYNGAEPVHGELLAAPRRLHPVLIEAMTAPGGSGPSTAGGRASA